MIFLLRVNPQGVMNGGAEILDRHRAVHRFPRLRVTPANHYSALNASARQGNRKPSRPMVAPTGKIDLRCAPEVSDDQHERGGEQAALLEIFE